MSNDRRLLEMVPHHLRGLLKECPHYNGTANLLAAIEEQLLTPSAGRHGAKPEDVQWLYRFLNCSVFGPPQDAINRAHRILDALTSSATVSGEAVDRIHQFDAAIRRIAAHVGAVCGGVDTGPRGGHTAEEIIRCIDAKVEWAAQNAEERGHDHGFDIGHVEGLTAEPPLRPTVERIKDDVLRLLVKTGNTEAFKHVRAHFDTTDYTAC